jgi:hypothetical protein
MIPERSVANAKAGDSAGLTSDRARGRQARTEISLPQGFAPVRNPSCCRFTPIAPCPSALLATAASLAGVGLAVLAIRVVQRMSHSHEVVPEDDLLVQRVQRTEGAVHGQLRSASPPPVMVRAG